MAAEGAAEQKRVCAAVTAPQGAGLICPHIGGGQGHQQLRK